MMFSRTKEFRFLFEKVSAIPSIRN
jgi:hypothetical protein